MRRCSIAAVAAAVLSLALLAGCGGGGGGAAPPPPTPGQTVITGRVISSQGGTGVPGVLIKFGSTAVVQAVSDATGNFSLNLGVVSGTVLQQYYPFPPQTFQVDTTGAGENYPNFLPVQYEGQPYEQIPILGGASLPVPAGVLAAPASGITSLGVITVTYSNPDEPPPPPF